MNLLFEHESLSACTVASKDFCLLKKNVWK